VSCLPHDGVCRSVSHHDLKRESDKTTYGEAQVSCLPHDDVCRSVSHHDLKKESDKTTYGEAQVSCLPPDGVCRSVSHCAANFIALLNLLKGKV
jgi:hypothetical protein